MSAAERCSESESSGPLSGIRNRLGRAGATQPSLDLEHAFDLDGAVHRQGRAAHCGASVPALLGEHRDDDFRTCDILVQNPAVPATSPFVAIARAAGAQIEMEMTLFFRFCPAPIIAITGTKGKTTTATLTAHLLKSWRSDTILAGNMRISALAQLALIGPDTPVVLELSSFVLEGLGAAGLSPAIAAITNIHPDHLDRYGSMPAYIAAKAAIGAHQQPADFLVLNARDAALQKLAPTMPGTVAWSDTASIPDAPIGSVYWNGDALHAVLAHKTMIVATQADVQLSGMHNRANIATAVALALRAGMPYEGIAAALASAALSTATPLRCALFFQTID
jgi:UDP-N-acetylmuramoylalanine--D-glutamate ligase